MQSVDRAVAILEILARDGEAGVTEVARELGVHKSTASRLLAALDRRELVVQDAARGKFRLGVGIVRLAGAVSQQLDVVQESSRPNGAASSAGPARSTRRPAARWRKLSSGASARPFEVIDYVRPLVVNHLLHHDGPAEYRDTTVRRLARKIDPATHRRPDRRHARRPSRPAALWFPPKPRNGSVTCAPPPSGWPWSTRRPSRSSSAGT